MRSRCGISVLTACGLALALMAMTASGAQAGMWMVNAKNVLGELKVELGVEIEPLGVAKEKHIVFTTIVGSNSVSFLCHQTVLSKAVIMLEVFKVTAQYAECIVYVNEKRWPQCDPLNQPFVVNMIATPLLHEGKSYAKIESPEGLFAVMKFDEEECVALPEEAKVTGTIWVEDFKNEFEFEKEAHLIQEAKIPAEKLGGLMFNLKKMSTNGSANIFFNDIEHKGLFFSGLAE